MQCPDCGYVISAFDKECPRCKNFTAQGKRPPTHLKPLPPEEAAYLVDTSQPVIPTKQTLPDKPAQMLSAELLACAVCENEAVQKVSAICQSGTWVTHSKGQTIGMADDGYGHAMMVGGSSTTTSQGRTHLALMLAPPPRPTNSPIGGCAVTLILVFLILGGLGVLIGQNQGDGGSLVLPIILLIAGGLIWLLQWLGVRSRRDQAIARLPNWEKAVGTWNRLFYCSRCDHVYNPQTHESVPVNQMHQLL